MSKKALVTGASGFIGSTLIEELGALGFDVYALMRKTSSPRNLEGLKYTKVDGDLADLDSLRSAVQGMDYVFHLAGVISAKNRDAFFEHNAEGTRRLAQAVAEKCPNLTRFVYVSSLAAAGPAKTLSPRVEGEPEQPVSVYGESKRQGEVELLKYKDTYPVSIVRPPLVYGPKDRGVLVIIQTVARNIMPIIRGANPEGQKYYSAIHGRDLCQGIIRAGTTPKEKVPSGEIFFMAGDGIYTYQEVLTTIARNLGNKPIRFKVPQFLVKVAAYSCTAAGYVLGKTLPLNMDKLNEILPDYWICSNEKAKNVLGFVPQYDLNKGMSDTIQWYREKRWIH